MEFLTRNPDFVQIHDAFSEKEVAEMVSAAGDLSPVVTNNVANSTERAYLLDPLRSSSTSLLKPNDTAEKNLNRKVETMTGLRSTDLSSKEEAKIASYMPGGHFEYHTDPVSHSSLMITHASYRFNWVKCSVLIKAFVMTSKLDSGAAFIWRQRRSDSYFHGLCENLICMYFPSDPPSHFRQYGC